MKGDAPQVVNLSLGFKEPPLARLVLDQLSHLSRLGMNVLRGRLTPRVARFDIQLRGSHRSVTRALRLCRGVGIELHMKGPGETQAT